MAAQKDKIKDGLAVKMQELNDQRGFFNDSISHLESKIDSFKGYMVQNNLGKKEVAKRKPRVPKNTAEDRQSSMSRGSRMRWCDNGKY